MIQVWTSVERKHPISKVSLAQDLNSFQSGCVQTDCCLLQWLPVCHRVPHPSNKLFHFCCKIQIVCSPPIATKSSCTSVTTIQVLQIIFTAPFVLHCDFIGLSHFQCTLIFQNVCPTAGSHSVSLPKSTN